MVPTTTDTKQNLIDTALELIWQNSYGSVSVDDICKAAGVKKGSFYHFFPSKIDLTIAAMEEACRFTRLNFDRIFSAGTDPIKRFEDLADFMYEYQKESAAKYGHVCGCPFASIGSEIGAQEEGIRAKFDAISNIHERYYESTVRDMIADNILPADTNAKFKAQEIYTYLLGQMMMARIQNDLAPLKRDLKAGLLRLLGVKNKAVKTA